MQQQAERLSGQLIVVTGASSGVGYAATRHLVQHEGAIVVAVARRRVFRVEALAKVVGPDRLFSVTADISEAGQAAALFAMVLEKWGRVDGFVHAVNRALRLPALDVSDTEFDLTMQVNVKSALYGVQAVAPILREQGRGSVVIYNPAPERTAAFSASEAVFSAASCALSALTEGWGRQLDGTGVQVREVSVPADGTSAGVAPEVQLADALHACSFGLPEAVLPVARASFHVSEGSPVVLSARGGLSLTQF